MNIGYLISFRWYPPTSGAKVHAYQVAHQLAKKGHKIKTCFYWHDAPGLEVYRQRELFKFLSDIDVLYIRIHGDWAFEKATLLKALTLFRLPVVWEVNSPLEEVLIRRMRSNSEVRFLNFNRRMLAGMVNAAICVSKPMQDYAADFLKIRSTYVVPNGSDPEHFNPARRDDNLYRDNGRRFRVIWSGSSDYSWQGIDLISEVAEKIYEKDKDIDFVLITNLKHLNQHDIFDKNAVVLDEISYLDIPAYIASADCGLCLYHDYGWNGQFYFSPLKLYDYMASGLPVIATDAGQISEAVTHRQNGLLTDNNVDNIVEQVLFLKNNQQDAQRLGQNGRKEVERFYNWGRVAQQTEEILEGVTKGGN